MKTQIEIRDQINDQNKNTLHDEFEWVNYVRQSFPLATDIAH